MVKKTRKKNGGKKKVAKTRKAVRNAKRKEHLKKLEKAKLQAEQDKLDVEESEAFSLQQGTKMRMQVFINEYLLDFNGVRAAIAAGYTKNKNAAAVQAATLLRIPNIRKQIEDRLEARLDNLEVDRERVLKNIMKQYDKADEAENVRDALKAMEIIGRHLNMFPTTMRNDPTNPVNSVQTIIYMPSNGRS